MQTHANVCNLSSVLSFVKHMILLRKMWGCLKPHGFLAPHVVFVEIAFVSIMHGSFNTMPVFSAHEPCQTTHTKDCGPREAAIVFGTDWSCDSRVVPKETTPTKVTQAQPKGPPNGPKRCTWPPEGTEDPKTQSKFSNVNKGANMWPMIWVTRKGEH